MKPSKKFSVSERLQLAMSIRGLRQTDVAEKTSISKGTICHYIKGKFEPKADTIAILAQALNVSEMWLMGFDVPMERTAFVDPDDAEFLSSLPPLSLKEELPKEIVALNEFLYPFGHQIMRTNGKYYMDEAGELTEEELSDLLNAVSIAAKNASDLLIAKRSKELLSFLKPKR